MSYRTLILRRSLLTPASGGVYGRTNRSFSGLFGTPLIAVSPAVGYLGTLLGISLKPDTSMATFWPPSAILLAAFLLAPVPMWWIFLLAVLPVHLLAQVQAGGTTPKPRNTIIPLTLSKSESFLNERIQMAPINGPPVFPMNHPSASSTVTIPNCT